MPGLNKRTAYEWSMRVPLIMQYPSGLHAGTVVKEVVANIDIAPTLLEAAGLKSAGLPAFDGRSFWPLARGESQAWRTELLYEYYWEQNFPQTPTLFALRGDRYKYVRAHGVWDVDELYDLAKDPGETNNLVFGASYAPVIKTMRAKLFAALQQSDGMSIPLRADSGRAKRSRRVGGSQPAVFPAELMEKHQPGK